MCKTKVCLVAITACIMATLGSVGAQDTTSAGAEFYQLASEAWDFRSTPRPLDPNSSSDDNRLWDVSLKAMDLREDYWRNLLDQLAEVERDSMSPEEQMNYDVFRFIVSDELAQLENRMYLMPFNAEGGFHTGFAFRTNRNLRDSAAAANYLTALRDFREYTRAHIALLEIALDEGVVLPRVIMEGFDEVAMTYVSEPSESLFLQPLIRSKNAFSPPDYDMFYQQMVLAIDSSINPAYTELAEFLKNRYIPACTETIGVTELPGGEELYDQRTQYFTTREMSPKDVFELGQSEVRRIRNEMQEIIEELEFEGSFADFLEFLRTDPQFYAVSPRHLLSEASYHSKRIDGMLPKYFGKMPRLPYGVEPVPDEIAPRYTGGRYVPGSAHDHRSGTYWVNTYQLSSRPLYVLPSLTLHEAVPGHHLQISLAAEIENVPDFRSQYYISAFGEGWALYTEYLGKEMGVYETPYERFGALTYEMWRACRLVVDPGMHAFGWTRDQAVEFMASNTALSMHEVNTEINRYIGWPGQAVSYKIGELTIRELREKAEEALGDEFNIRDFHDKVLENGSVPLFVLERTINDWIDAQLSNG